MASRRAIVELDDATGEPPAEAPAAKERHAKYSATVELE